jgi:hypothetical protein
MDNAFEQAQDDRESAMSDVEQEYSVSASCDGTDCQYMLMTDDDSSILHPIEVDSKETVTFDGKEFRITATNTTVKAVTETEAGETVIVDIDKTL